MEKKIENTEYIDFVSLRDYFAARALNGLRSCSGYRLSSEEAARIAYQDADAMIKERTVLDQRVKQPEIHKWMK